MGARRFHRCCFLQRDSVALEKKLEHNDTVISQLHPSLQGASESAYRADSASCGFVHTQEEAAVIRQSVSWLLMLEPPNYSYPKYTAVAAGMQVFC